MNAGILLALAGVFVGAQVLGGGVLERLGIIGSSPASSSGKTTPGGAASGNYPGAPAPLFNPWNLVPGAGPLKGILGQSYPAPPAAVPAPQTNVSV